MGTGGIASFSAMFLRLVEDGLRDEDMEGRPLLLLFALLRLRRCAVSHRSWSSVQGLLGILTRRCLSRRLLIHHQRPNAKHAAAIPPTRAGTATATGNPPDELELLAVPLELESPVVTKVVTTFWRASKVCVGGSDVAVAGKRASEGGSNLVGVTTISVVSNGFASLTHCLY